jgi:hypothetical protein
MHSQPTNMFKNAGSIKKRSKFLGGTLLLYNLSKVRKKFPT